MALRSLLHPLNFIAPWVTLRLCIYSANHMFRKELNSYHVRNQKSICSSFPANFADSLAYEPHQVVPISPHRIRNIFDFKIFPATKRSILLGKFGILFQPEEGASVELSGTASSCLVSELAFCSRVSEYIGGTATHAAQSTTSSSR